MDISENKPGYLLQGQDHPPIKISQAAFHLLKGRKEGKSFESLASSISEIIGNPISPQHLRVMYRHTLDQIDQIRKNPKKQSSGHFLKTTIINRQTVIRVADQLSGLFKTPVAAVLVATMAIICIRSIDFFRTIPFSFDDAGFGWAFLLFAISLFFHEFGHASACRRFNADPDEIGFTLYLIWPSMYCNVSDAWKLNRYQRVVVDVGGIYFQALLGSLYLLIYIVFAWKPLVTASAMIGYTILFSLNPAFKFDAYWVLCDILGVVNLSDQKWPMISNIVDRIIGREPKKSPFPKHIRIWVAGFTFLSFGVWAYFIGLLVPVAMTALNRLYAVLKPFF